MIDARWLFPALVAAIVTAVILGRQLWMLVVLLYLLYRVMTLKQPAIFKRSLLALMIALLVCWRAEYLSRVKPLPQPLHVDQLVKMQPDQLKINGNLAQFQGTNLATGEVESISLRLQNSKQKAWLLQNHQVLRWQIQGSLQPIVGATNFNQFDQRQYQWRHHIYNELRADTGIWRPVRSTTPIDVCHCLRAWLHQYFQQFPTPFSQYCDSLIIGLNTTDTTRLFQTVKQLGVIHLFCISGMHVVLLVELLRGLLIRLHWEIETIDLFLILLLPFYLIIGGGSASLIRALMMTEARLMARCFGRSQVDAWSFSLMAGLIIDPYVLLTLGGQLSYLMSLLLPLSLTQATALKRSLWLNLASLPSLLHYVYEFHLLSWLVSWLMIPLFNTVLFPITLFLALTGRWLPWGVAWFNTLLKLLHGCLDFLAACPGMIHFGKLSTFEGMILLLLTLMTLTTFNRRWLTWLLVSYVVIFIGIHFPLSGEVTFVDIGQGDCAIIRLPLNRQVIMIDTGGKLHYRLPSWAQSQSTSDQATRTSLNYLKSEGIATLDAVCLSHSDADHIGYLPTVLKNMRVKRLLVPLGMEENPKFKRLITRSVKVTPVKADDQLANLPFQILHPFVRGPGGNEDSMVLFGHFANLDFVFTGDLTRQAECAVARRYPWLRADVLKLSHHGSKTGSDPYFLKQLQPKLGIISAGRFNRYGHPNNVTMQRLKIAQITPVSTQKYGMITFYYYGTHGYWKTKLKGDEVTWMLPPYANS